jgi:hypothetical protein
VNRIHTDAAFSGSRADIFGVLGRVMALCFPHGWGNDRKQDSHDSITTTKDPNPLIMTRWEAMLGPWLAPDVSRISAEINVTTMLQQMHGSQDHDQLPKAFGMQNFVSKVSRNVSRYAILDLVFTDGAT